MKIILTLLFSATFFFFTGKAFADSICPRTASFGGLCLGSDDLGRVVGTGTEYLFVIAIIIALLYLVWGGLKWLTSGGDKTALQAAREHIVAAVVGLIIVFLSYFILAFLIKFFIPDFDITEFDLPTVGTSGGSGSSGSECSAITDGYCVRAQACPDTKRHGQKDCGIGQVCCTY
ncbi:MAG: hypothetical protein A3B38_03615 [Candidatus Levybacteria bacterium RIFCSPLOWO2_01_FULL_36_13]|nr:MAG: hypothetical protein A2684_00550 [Candidatus Levybacteria bacterium RIFCSPHIGHO2_01_FULL_36_15b]OGH34220.1 MAG: hypothetical protein A3B38_03615 [Candidatus Levybacteria bacterium RIFCSPLOWO2_01_FULL_36_13]